MYVKKIVLSDTAGGVLTSQGQHEVFADSVPVHVYP